MALLAECPMCHKKQSAKNKLCKCGEDMDKLKRSKKVKFWITYRLPGGTQRREVVPKHPYSIEEARNFESKRRVQKKEKRIFDVKPETTMTFNELKQWYLGLEKVKTLTYYDTLKIYLEKFCREFGNKVVSEIKFTDLENLQARRKAEGKADATIDQEIVIAKGMINKAFYDDLVSGETLKVFKKIGKLLKPNANARKRILSMDEFERLMNHLPQHTKWILVTSFYTGMRLGEITSLTWDKVSLDKRVIELEAQDTKDNEPRSIPICEDLYTILKSIPKAIHCNRVFLYNGKPVRNIRGSLKTACVRAEIAYGRFAKGGFIFHDCRHSFNTYMRKTGVAQSVIMELTGHSTPAMFNRYNTVDMEERDRQSTHFRAFCATLPKVLTKTLTKCANKGSTDMHTLHPMRCNPLKNQWRKCMGIEPT